MKFQAQVLEIYCMKDDKLKLNSDQYVQANST